MCSDNKKMKKDPQDCTGSCGHLSWITAWSQQRLWANFPAKFKWICWKTSVEPALGHYSHWRKKKKSTFNFPIHSPLPRSLTDEEHGWSLNYFKWSLISHQSAVRSKTFCIFKPQHNLPKSGGRVSTLPSFISTFPLPNKNIIQN